MSDGESEVLRGRMEKGSNLSPPRRRAGRTSSPREMDWDFCETSSLGSCPDFSPLEKYVSYRAAAIRLQFGSCAIIVTRKINFSRPAIIDKDIY